MQTFKIFCPNVLAMYQQTFVHIAVVLLELLQ